MELPEWAQPESKDKPKDMSNDEIYDKLVNVFPGTFSTPPMTTGNLQNAFMKMKKVTAPGAVTATNPYSFKLIKYSTDIAISRKGVVGSKGSA